MTEPPMARIFLSSGQRAGSNEERLIEDLADRIRSILHFDVTVGSERSAPMTVGSDVEHRLSRSEYFVQVDFDLSRDLERKEEGWQERSLFSHQEFAVAVFLGLQFLVLREEGLGEPGGVFKYVAHGRQPIRFNRTNLIDTALGAIRGRIADPNPESRWDRDWRRELRVGRRLRGTDNTGGWTQYGKGRYPLFAKYFHVDVTNEHRDLVASDVHAYVETITPDSAKKARPIHPLPLKWHALNTESTAIPPRTTTKFSGLLMFQHEPGIARIGYNVFLVDTNALEDEYTIRAPGKFRLGYAVYSREFFPSRKELILNLGRTPEDTELLET